MGSNVSSKNRMLKFVCLFQNMKLGIFDVIPRGSLDGLMPEDLRLLLNGVGDIDVQTLISYTSFNDESGEGGEKVQRFKRWFWSIVEKMSSSERQDLVCISIQLGIAYVCNKFWNLFSIFQSSFGPFLTFI